jgi:hypothetical protein
MNKDIESVLERLDKIKYGWIGKDKVLHKYSKQEFFLDNYRLMSIEDTLSNNVGTNFENACVAKKLLNDLNIDSNIYFFIYEDKHIASHAICIANIDNKYYSLENNWILDNNKREFDSIEDIFKLVKTQLRKTYVIEPFEEDKVSIYKVDSLKDGLGYDELLESVKS